MDMVPILGPRLPAVKAKARTLRACIPCHRAKLSCDNKRPCTRCSNRRMGLSECVDYVSERRGRKPKWQKVEVSTLTIDPARMASWTLRVLFRIYQEYFNTHRIPLPSDALTQRIRLWRTFLAPFELERLSNFVVSVGDADYQHTVMRAHALPPITSIMLPESDGIKRLADSIPSLQQDKVSPAMLDLLPVGFVFSAIDPARNTSMYYMNRKMLSMLEYTRADLHRIFRTGFELLETFIHPQFKHTVLHQVEKNLLQHLEEFTIVTALLSKSGVTKYVSMTMTIGYTTSGAESTFLICVVPLPYALPTPAEEEEGCYIQDLDEETYTANLQSGMPFSPDPIQLHQHKSPNSFHTSLHNLSNFSTPSSSSPSSSFLSPDISPSPYPLLSSSSASFSGSSFPFSSATAATAVGAGAAGDDNGVGDVLQYAPTPFLSSSFSSSSSRNVVDRSSQRPLLDHRSVYIQSNPIQLNPSLSSSSSNSFYDANLSQIPHQTLQPLHSAYHVPPVLHNGPPNMNVYASAPATSSSSFVPVSVPVGPTAAVPHSPSSYFDFDLDYLF